MEVFLIDNSTILLQENIPLSAEDIKHIETQQKVFTTTIPVVLAICSLFTMALIALCIKDDFAGFKYYDYTLFTGAGVALFGFCYFIAWLLNKRANYNWKKDKLNGKNKLISVLINRDETEYGEYLTFAGQLKNDKIRIRIRQEDYYRYKVGTKISVTYLKFSKEALEIAEF